MVAAAVIGSAVVGAGASIATGNKAAKAAQKGADQSAAVQQYMYDTTRQDYAPYRQVGYDALDQLASISGLPSDKTYGDYVRANPDILEGYNKSVDKKQFPSVADYGRYHWQTYGQGENRKLPQSKADPYAGFTASPGYLFRLQQGQKAIERSAAARGGLYSGATMKAVDANAQGIASDEFSNYVARLQSLAGVGQSATGSTAAAGQNYASGMSQAYQNAGAARASAYANTGNAINSAVGGIAGGLLYQQGFNMQNTNPAGVMSANPVMGGAYNRFMGG